MLSAPIKHSIADYFCKIHRNLLGTNEGGIMKRKMMLYLKMCL